MTADPVSQFALVLGVTSQLVAAVPEPAWTDPTPCADWSVHDLVGHLIAGNLLFARALDGRPPAPAPACAPGSHTQLAHLESVTELLGAFSQPGVLDRIVTVPFGSVPGHVALHLRTTETLVHGWDLARATGQPTAFPAGLADQELAFSESRLADVPSERRPFAPPRPVPDGAPAIDRLAACLGRDVAWRPSLR
jgi:uncharacterized protein (TIGR03086 family)